MTHQRLAILEYAQRERRVIDDFLELSVSSGRSFKERKLDVLVARSTLYRFLKSRGLL